MQNDIGMKLKQLRKDKCLSQQELADRAKITRSTISNYEIGRRTPHLKDLQRLATILGVGLDFFGVQPQDEAFELVARAKQVFDNPNIEVDVKEELYRSFMKIYLDMKRG